MIFYFTGTGNSLYVAKQLEKEPPVSIPQVLKEEPGEFVADTIGVVCPVYAGYASKIVARFLEKFRFKTEYFYDKDCNCGGLGGRKC